MGYSFVYVILHRSGAAAPSSEQFVADRLNAIRGQLPQDAAVTIGPNASSMGSILSTRSSTNRGVHDLRELRLLNESLVKPALQSAGGVAEVASVGGLEKQYQVKLFPPLLSQRGVSLAHVLSAVRGAFQEAGGRTIEVTSREYRLRGGVGTRSHRQAGVPRPRTRSQRAAGTAEGRRLSPGRLRPPPRDRRSRRHR